jgi:hypothetical protein
VLSYDNVAAQTVPAPYNPYPPGILPPDLPSEIASVRSEVASIESEALAQWAALPPPTLTGPPPTLQGTGMRANQLKNGFGIPLLEICDNICFGGPRRNRLFMVAS